MKLKPPSKRHVRVRKKPAKVQLQVAEDRSADYAQQVAELKAEVERLKAQVEELSKRTYIINASANSYM